jgi:predicted RNA polymerase sigma factor
MHQSRRPALRRRSESATAKSSLPTDLFAETNDLATSNGAEHGLPLIDRLVANGQLDGYLPRHATRADLHRRIGRNDEAKKSYRRALELVETDAERRFLEKCLAEVSASSGR